MKLFAKRFAEYNKKGISIIWHSIYKHIPICVCIWFLLPEQNVLLRNRRRLFVKFNFSNLNKFGMHGVAYSRLSVAARVNEKCYTAMNSIFFDMGWAQALKNAVLGNSASDAKIRGRPEITSLLSKGGMGSAQK